MASATHPVHAAPSRSREPRGDSRTIQSSPSAAAAAVATAVTPPMSRTATADHDAARRTEPWAAYATSGTSTHGASANGRDSAEIGPSVESIRGARANAMPATQRASGGCSPISRASRTVPRNAVQSSTVHHARCTIQGSSERSRPTQKNGPIGNR